MNAHMTNRTGALERMHKVVDIDIKNAKRGIRLSAVGSTFGSALTVASFAAFNYKFSGLGGTFLTGNRHYYDLALAASGLTMLASCASAANMAGNSRIVRALKKRSATAFSIALGSAVGSVMLNAPKDSLLYDSPSRWIGYLVIGASVALTAANMATLPVFLHKVKEARRA
ncbi:MAG: hypothetical protein KGH69_03630 [Candidatus Micrarchaeota archaeon]|nr:hypothetical protein [Candidatus Micrarchaeota archaeon]